LAVMHANDDSLGRMGVAEAGHCRAAAGIDVFLAGTVGS
jgi:hypothetical protein